MRGGHRARASRCRGLRRRPRDLPARQDLRRRAVQRDRGAARPARPASSARERPFGYGWIFPAVDGVSNVGVYLRADAYAGLGRNLYALLAGFIGRHAARFATAEAVGKPRAWSLPLGPRPIPHGAPGLLLTG